MYQQPASSSSSSLQEPAVLAGLTRLGSAPGAFLARAADAVVGGDLEYTELQGSSSHGGGARHQYFSRDSSSVTLESTCDDHNPSRGGLQRSYGLNQISNYDAAESLVRQRSSPAGFLSYHVPENGFTITNGSDGYSSRNGNSGGHTVSRLKSQLSCTRQDSLSHTSRVGDNVVEVISSNSSHKNSNHTHPAATFLMESWDNTNSIAFSGPQSKQARTSNGDIYSCLNALEIQYNVPQTTLQMATMDNRLNIPEDSTPYKIRAKRGCATHPRSVAERERRNRISEKLKRLYQLAPNIDKQTNYADMLDMAVQHINGLQNEIQVGKNPVNFSCFETDKRKVQKA